MSKPQPRLYRLLLLEDDLEAAGKILAALHRIEPHLAPYDLDVTLLSTCQAVEDLVNARAEAAYDVILLDRDCKLDGSFHVLDIERFGADRVISISSNREWNRLAEARGVAQVVPKSFSDLDGFAMAIGQAVLALLTNCGKALGPDRARQTGR